MNNLISLQNVNKSFKQKKLFSDFNLNCKIGDFLTILGPSGCGKSTLIRMISGLEPIDRGQIILPSQSNIGFVFQEPTLLPWLTALENVCLPIEIKKNNKMTRADGEIQLERVGLKESFHLYPHEMSGGIKMRVSLARALIKKPQILILDEPFSALDEFTRFDLQNQLLELWNETGMLVILVTHSIYEACFLSQRILLLEKEGGKIFSDHILNYTEPRMPSFRESSEFIKSVKLITTDYYKSMGLT